MGLKEYKNKRHFDITNEPGGDPEQADNGGGLIFVVQKHDASHLHYDFRLEWDGVLKSWAVPKGPSMNPSERRLAVLVEDHPLEYAAFHGTIPEGEYGAGTVKIWDRGTWEPAEGFTDVDRALAEGLLEFSLDGKNLKGKFALIRPAVSYTKNGWLLVKKQDSESVRGRYDANRIEPLEG